MSALSPEAFVLPLCDADRCWQCPGINSVHDRCTCRCHGSLGPDEEELEAMKLTMEKPHADV